MPSSTGDIADLRDVHDTMRLSAYLRELGRRRSYMWYVAVSELRSRQMSSTLGNLWHLLNPILQVAIYWLIFGVFIDDVARGVDNYILFLAIGIFVFMDIQRATIAGAGSLQNNKGLIRSLHFPRALIPMTAVLTEFLATLPSVFVIYATALGTGADLRWTWILLPVVLVVQFVFNIGAGMVASRATAHVRDVTQVLPFLFRLGLYLSGVIFAVEAFATPAQIRLFEINPMYCFIQIARWTMLGGPLKGAWLISAGLWTVLLPALALVWFRGGEELYGRD